MENLRSFPSGHTIVRQPGDTPTVSIRGGGEEASLTVSFDLLAGTDYEIVLHTRVVNLADRNDVDFIAAIGFFQLVKP